MQVYASLPKITVLKGGGEVRKEIYVLSFAADLNSKLKKRQPAVGAANETIDRLTPEGSDFFVLSVSNVFEGIKNKIPLSLSGDGVILYPPRDPKGMLGLHFAVVESDQGTRDLGTLLGSIFKLPSVKSTLAEVAKYTALTIIPAAIPPAVLTAAFGAVATALPIVLKANKDDVLMCHSHSGVEFNNYGGASARGVDFQVGNDRVDAVLRVWAKE